MLHTPLYEAGGVSRGMNFWNDIFAVLDYFRAQWKLTRILNLLQSRGVEVFSGAAYTSDRVFLRVRDVEAFVIKHPFSGFSKPPEKTSDEADWKHAVDSMEYKTQPIEHWVEEILNNAGHDIKDSFVTVNRAEKAPVEDYNSMDKTAYLSVDIILFF